MGSHPQQAAVVIGVYQPMEKVVALSPILEDLWQPVRGHGDLHLYTR